MNPDEIRRSWDDDEAPRSVFPEPLAERLTRENKELRAEVERLRITPDNVERMLGIDPNDPFEKIAGAYVRLRNDVEALASRWAMESAERGPGDTLYTDGVVQMVRAVLDKHAGEQPRSRTDSNEAKRQALQAECDRQWLDSLGPDPKRIEAARRALDKHAGGTDD